MNVWNALRLHTEDACVVCCTSEKKNSCTHKGVKYINFYQYWTRILCFFSYPRDDEKKEIFALSFCCVINNDAKPAWLNRKSNEYAIQSAYREPTTIGIFLLFMYSFMHTFHKFYASHLHPARPFRHPRELLSSSSSSECIMMQCKELSHVWCTRKKREKFWNLSITRFMHFYHPVGCMNAHSHKFLHSHNESMKERGEMRWNFFSVVGKKSENFSATEKCACVFYDFSFPTPPYFFHYQFRLFCSLSSRIHTYIMHTKENFQKSAKVPF